MVKLSAPVCIYSLILGCHTFPQIRRSEVRDDLEIKCSFDDDQLAIVTSTQGQTAEGNIPDIDFDKQVTPNPAYSWENGEIPYYFNLHANIRRKRENEGLIEEAMQEIEKRTCFRFLKLDSEPVEQHHLEIKIGEPSCKGRGFSAGVREGGPYKLVLESEWQIAGNSRCLDWHDGVLHELMHVVGVMHTQKRKDRDDYITINEDNIRDVWKAQYQYLVCENCNSFGVPYDCSSIMHYGTGTYGKDGKDTMTAKNSHDCELSRVGAAFDGRGATETDWNLISIVAKRVCSGPTSVTPRYDTACLTDGGPDVGSPCVFPFIFDGKTYNECTLNHADDGVTPWCSTKTDRRDRHVGGEGKYGTCGDQCPKETDDDDSGVCITSGGPDSGSPCVFPFMFDGDIYYECTVNYADDGVTPWCSTKTDGRGRHIGGEGNYGNCGQECGQIRGGIPLTSSLSHQVKL